MRPLVLLACLIIPLNLLAQKGKVEGKVTDVGNGKPLAGVSVTVSGLGEGTFTNVDGYFNLSLESGRKYTLIFSLINYGKKEVAEVAVTAGHLNNLDITMEVLPKSGTEVIIRSTARRESTNSMIAYQKSAPVVAQVVSAEAIRRSPDKNTGEILKRVPGTSVQDGKYLVVRGLADRYNQAMLNGILLSSTEPDRKTFSFDLFPAPMIDNIIINKTFIPELPGEWAGGLIQVNTKEIPGKDFLNVKIGTGFNSQTIGHTFYSYNGGRYDWLGLDDKSRGLPSGIPTKSNFEKLTPAQKNEWAKEFSNTWTSNSGSAPLNASFEMNGGFSTKLFNKKFGGNIGLSYNKSVRRLEYNNRFFTINEGKADVNFDYYNNKYAEDVLTGALANVTMYFNANHKISFRNLFNINSTDYTIDRTGTDFESDPSLGENVRASEFAFKSNIYNNSQLSGEHNFNNSYKLKWYGAFGILDQYIPDQRRVQYNQSNATADAPYLLLMSNTLSQKSGSRFYSNLNDYVYTAGGDLSKGFDWLGYKQTVKGGYLFQVKDRLFDARPFSIYLPLDNPDLKEVSPGQIFSPENFNTNGNMLSFDEISALRFRYVANSILNAGYLQLDNQFSNKIRVVWGLRVEHFDQVVGSMKKDDPRHVYSEVLDLLPGVNLTYKLKENTNLRFAVSQTVIRPEFREISSFAFFDFELGATILGNPGLQRTKITNLDLRYELYPGPGQLITIGAFYKHFDNPIELFFNQSGVGTSSTFNYLNAEKAEGYGIELEMRKKMEFIPALKNFTAYGNASYITNKVEDTKANIKRPMQGQSPYVLNAGLQYDHPHSGFSGTFLFNQIGRRILYVGNEQIPAIWEHPRPVLDLQIAQKVFRQKGEVRLNIADILNKSAYYYHDLDDNKKLKLGTDAMSIRRNYGTTFSLTFYYNII